MRDRFYAPAAGIRTKTGNLIISALQPLGLKAVRARAHAPYSRYLVGAAVLDEKGRIHSGCNVENAAYPEGICAETSAIAAMVASGGTRIVAIAAVGGHQDLEVCTPCGGCRQRISEFADKNTRIILLDDQGKPRRYTMDELLPASFRLP